MEPPPALSSRPVGGTYEVSATFSGSFSGSSDFQASTSPQLAVVIPIQTHHRRRVSPGGRADNSRITATVTAADGSTPIGSVGFTLTGGGCYLRLHHHGPPELLGTRRTGHPPVSPTPIYSVTASFSDSTGTYARRRAPGRARREVDYRPAAPLGHQGLGAVGDRFQRRHQHRDDSGQTLVIVVVLLVLLVILAPFMARQVTGRHPVVQRFDEQARSACCCRSRRPVVSRQPRLTFGVLQLHGGQPAVSHGPGSLGVLRSGPCLDM